jgi:hypothetical protein
MTGSEADFHRLMPLAFPGIAWDPARRRFTPHDGDWWLELSQPGRLRVANVGLPTITATFGFAGADAAAVLARFHRYFQRGGG